MTISCPLRSAGLLGGILLLSAASAGAADLASLADGFYKAGFTADKLPAAVRERVASVDDRALPFKELDFQQSAAIKITGGGDVSSEASVRVIAQGGSLVTIMSTDQSTDTYAAIQYELSYRGLLVLRDQKYLPNMPIILQSMRKPPANHTPIMEVQTMAMDPAVPVLSAGSRLTIDFAVAPSETPARAEKMRRVCQVGEDFPAAKVSQAFTGNARVIACDLFDDAGRSRDLHQEKIYLDDYGVALLSKVVTSRMTADFSISGVDVKR